MLDRSDSLTTLAFRKFEKMILAGELKPGERLNEHRFASGHGLSRGPVRAACRALEHAGSVVSVPARGFYVRELSEHQISGVYDLRAAITGLICADAARHATRRSVGKLPGLNDEMREAADSGVRDEHYRIDLEFHVYIAQLAKNETAKRIYDGISRETRAHRIACSIPMPPSPSTPRSPTPSKRATSRPRAGSARRTSGRANSAGARDGRP